ncbi:transposase-like protein [Corynebacterium pilosum]|uniref:Transposase-like protein n=2 Tax=Corynebacterium pilosum TaxID=35756 RepID=A0A376CKV6_9CORY|nr:transposase-like protein [Corynebacterium pilosum]
MLPQDHAKTWSFRNLKGADEYRAMQGQLLREGKIDEVFQIEYDFLTGSESGGRYNQALEETIDYALEKGFITKRPTGRLAAQATNT